MNARELQKALGISRTTLDRYKSAGMPYTPGAKKRGRGGACSFDMDAVVEWMRQVGRTGDVGRPAFSNDETLPAKPTEEPPAAQPPAIPMPAEAGKLARLDRGELARLRVAADVHVRRLEIKKRERQEREAAGELVERVEVLEAMRRIVMAARQRLEAIPDAAASRVAGEDDPRVIAAVLRDQIDGALDALSKSPLSE